MNAKAPRFGAHSFRHFYASMLIEQGLNPKKVQALLGHSSIQVTFETYGHLFPADPAERAAMAALQARLIPTDTAA
jgi:integrase